MATGYADCTCRDCFEIAIPTSDNDGLCRSCQDAGCEPNDGECCAPTAYGMSDEED